MLRVEKYNSEKQYPRHESAHPKGGVSLKDDGSISDVCYDVIKKVGSKIAEGSVTDIMKISRPLVISYPKSYLEAMANDLLYTPFLSEAAAQKDPVKRLSYVVAFFIAGLHRNSTEMASKGPMDSYLGETFQAVKKDGTRLYCEQLSINPLASAYLVVGPNNSYQLSGSGQLEAQMTGINNIGGKRTGETTLKFKDGTIIRFGNPVTIIDSLVVGERRLNFTETCEFVDEKNKILAVVSFKYNNESTLSAIGSAFKGLFWKSEEKPPTDTFEVNIYNDKKMNSNHEKEILSKGSGSWVSYFQMSGELLWRVNDPIDKHDPWVHEQKKLPSDSTLRQDLKYLKLGDLKKAQKEKDNMDSQQEKDQKLKAKRRPNTK